MKNQEREFIKFEGKEIDILSSLKQEPELVMSWFSSLTDLEQKILSSLYNLNKAVTIKEIRNTLIQNSTEFMKSKKNFSDRLYFNFPFPNYYNFSTKSIEKVKKDHAIKTEKILDNFPSFRRIDKTIQDLISLKIVFERGTSELKNKKIKGLYYLNPIVRHQLNKIRDKHVKEEKARKNRVDDINKELIKSGSKVQMNY